MIMDKEQIRKALRDADNLDKAAVKCAEGHEGHIKSHMIYAFQEGANWQKNYHKQESEGLREWVSVEDRLPKKKNEEYLVYDPNIYVGIRILRLASNNSWYSDIGDAFHPTHWMDLPPSPPHLNKAND